MNPVTCQPCANFMHTCQFEIMRFQVENLYAVMKAHTGNVYMFLMALHIFN